MNGPDQSGAVEVPLSASSLLSNGLRCLSTTTVPGQYFDALSESLAAINDPANIVYHAEPSAVPGSGVSVTASSAISSFLVSSASLPLPLQSQSALGLQYASSPLLLSPGYKGGGIEEWMLPGGSSPLSDSSTMMTPPVAVNGASKEESRSWSERRRKETPEDKAKRIATNRQRMAERRARENPDERAKRLQAARLYARAKLLRETEEEREKRRMLNRIRTAIRRQSTKKEITSSSSNGALDAVVKEDECSEGGRVNGGGVYSDPAPAPMDSLEAVIESLIRGETEADSVTAEEESTPSESSIVIKGESSSERLRRLATAREYAQQKRARESAEQRATRLEKNRVRMREKRRREKEAAGFGGCKLWRNYLRERPVIQERLGLLRNQLAASEANRHLNESDRQLEATLQETAHQLHFTPTSGVLPVDPELARSLYLSTHVPNILRVAEERLAGQPDTGFFLFGPEVSFTDYALYEQLESLCRLAPSVLESFPALRAFKTRFNQRLTFTTYALMRVAAPPPLMDDT